MASARRTSRRQILRPPGAEPVVDFGDPNEIRPATRPETVPLLLAGVLLALIALIIGFTRGYMLLYGDAVAHLAIARRILDSRNPGLQQFGSVWLPLPHLLMLPFVQKMLWWQTGLAGTWPSLACYIASVAGMYRLARRVLVPRWAFAATAFYALNPNLLYLSTTAMTEPLFLALLLWSTLITIECVSAIRADQKSAAAKRLALLGVLLAAAVLTRYDGWVIDAVVWCVIAWELMQRGEMRQKLWPAFLLFTLLVVAAPAGWLAYNQHYYHDPLDFLRGPYSAVAIEAKTSPAGSGHYDGWHNPLIAAMYYTRAAQLDASIWETGFAVLAASIAGLVILVRRKLQIQILLLWLPLPFYIYSVAYGAVPIFLPKLHPFSYYNTRYGMEMLPAFAVFLFVAIAAFEDRMRKDRPEAAKWLEGIALGLIVANAGAMVYTTPLVLKEAQVNSSSRVPFEAALQRELNDIPPGSTILMYNSDHVGALQRAGIPLKQTINEGDWASWQAALADPAHHAPYIVAIEGDPVAKAVAAHGANLSELTVLCSTGQPCARIYKSNAYQERQ